MVRGHGILCGKQSNALSIEPSRLGDSTVAHCGP